MLLAFSSATEWKISSRKVKKNLHITGVFSACGSMGGLSGVKNCSSYNGTWWNGTCYTVQDVGTDAYQSVSKHAQTLTTHPQIYQP